MTKEMDTGHLLMCITRMDGGGTERFAATIANTLARSGRSVTLCSLHPSPEEGGKRWLESTVSFLELGVSARVAAPRLRRLCREHPDQPVLALGPEIGLVLVGLKALRLIRNPVVYRESTAMWRHNSPAWRWLHRLLLSRVNGLISQTWHGLEEARSKNRSRAVDLVLPNPCAALEAFPDLPPPVAERDAPTLLVVGRLESMKGQARVLRAMPGLLARFPRVRLHIVGVGSCEGALRELSRELGLEDAVVFQGFCADPTLWYRAADVLVLPSDYEGLPNVLFEAVACGCRIVTSDGEGGILETMQALGLEAFVLPLASFETGLPEKIREVLDSDPELWAEAGSRLEAMAHPQEIAEDLWGFVMSLRTEAAR